MPFTDRDTSSIDGVDADVFDAAYSTVTAAASRKGDADMELASAWKAASERGIHVPALKVARKLSRGNPAAATVFLKALHAYCERLGVFDQHELPFDRPGDQFEPIGEQDFDQTDPAPAPDIQPAERPHLVEPATGTDIPDDAGAIFNAGQDAAAEGSSIDSNPYPTEQQQHIFWRKGFRSYKAKRAK